MCDLNSKRIVWLFTLFSFALVFGTGFIAAPARAEIDVFKIGAGADLDSLDPVAQTTGHIINMMYNCWEPLVHVDKNGQPKLALAEKIDVVDDGAALNVKIRKGITFHDGTPLDAEAVKWNWDRLLDPNVKVRFRSFVSEMKSVEVIDSHTVQVRLKYPSAIFHKKMSLFLFSVVSPTSAKKQEINKHPVGTGPYKFVEYTPGDKLVFERNENYWGKKPEIKKLVFYIIRENTTREAMLLAGDLDMIYKPSASSIDGLERNSDIIVAKRPTWRCVYFAMNNKKAPFTDVRVRQAFNYAVDKKAIIENVLFGLGTPQRGAAPSMMFGYAQGDVQYDYNPEKAMKLLKEANFDFSQTILMGSPQGRLLMDKQVSETVQAYLQALGIKVELRTFDWPTYIARNRKPLNETEHQISMTGWASFYNDANYYMCNVHSKANHPPNGSAYSFYSNDEFEALCRIMDKELDESKREEMLKKAGRLLYNEAPWIYLYFENIVVAYKNKYTGVDIYPTEMFFTHNVTLR